MYDIENKVFYGAQRPPRWKIIVDDPDGVQVYVGEGLPELTARLKDFDRDDIRGVYISD